MSKKYLLIGIVSAVVAGLLAIVSGGYAMHVAGKNVRGHYMFLQTKNNISDLARIEITTADVGKITLYYNDGVWRFKEAADYFVNNDQLADFYEMINNSIIMAVNEGDDALFTKSAVVKPKEGMPQDSILIETYDAKGNDLDKVILGKIVDKQSKYRYARYLNNSYIYNISSAKNVHGSIEAWLPFPLLQIPDYAIDQIVINGDVVTNERLMQYLPRSANLQRFVTDLGYIAYIGPVEKEIVAEILVNSPANKIQIITKIGLVYDLDVYHFDNTYWIEVSLSYTALPKKEVISYVEENQKYFSDWLFALDKEQGMMFYNIRVAKPQQKK